MLYIALFLGLFSSIIACTKQQKKLEHQELKMSDVLKIVPIGVDTMIYKLDGFFSTSERNYWSKENVIAFYKTGDILIRIDSNKFRLKCDTTYTLGETVVANFQTDTLRIQMKAQKRQDYEMRKSIAYDAEATLFLGNKVYSDTLFAVIRKESLFGKKCK